MGERRMERKTRHENSSCPHLKPFFKMSRIVSKSKMGLTGRTKILFVVILLFLVQPVLAKENWVQRLPAGWIRSFPSESKVPSSSDYPTAGAVYLLNEDIYYVADKTEVKVVIMKIFNRRGYDYAEVVTPFYRQGESLEVRGRTKKKDGTVIELGPEDVHEISVSKDLRRKRFTLPGVERDCLIQYEIIHKSKRYNLSGIHYFQGEEPTLLSRFHLIVPKDLQVIVYDIPPGILDTTRNTPIHSENTSLYTFVKRDLLAEETEPGMPPLFNYAPSLAFSVTAPTEQEELTASWANISKWYLETIRTHFAPGGEMKKLAKKLTKECTEEKEKIEKIFSFVQSHFKVDFASRSIFDPAEAIFNRQVGSSAEVAGILYALLESAELEAVPVLVPNRQMVTDIPDVPMLDWFTHLLLRLELKDEELWLDPFSGANCRNCISEPYREVDGLLIQESGGKLIRTPSVGYSENSKRSVVHVSLTEDGNIHCQSQEIYSAPRSGKINSVLRNQTIAERKDDLAKKIRLYCPGATLDSFQLGDLYDYVDDFEIYCDFHSSYYVQKNDSILCLNPNILNRDVTAKDFAEPIRIYPIMFDETKMDVDSIVIQIPSSYEVLGTPDPINVETEFGEFRTEYRRQGSLIIYKRTFAIEKLLVPQSAYKEVKDFFNQIFEQDQKFITIRRRG
jgi:transglutaminase-like putative cysteine protease